jgi:hypothetical protein
MMQENTNILETPQLKNSLCIKNTEYVLMC